MAVVLLTREWEEAWQHFVEASPQAPLAHQLGWLNGVQKTYGHTPYYLSSVGGSAVTGVLPLFFMRNPLFGRFLVTAPYLTYGGRLARHESAGCKRASPK